MAWDVLSRDVLSYILDTSMRCVLYIKMFSKSLREQCLVLSILLVCQSCFTQRV